MQVFNDCAEVRGCSLQLWVSVCVGAVLEEDFARGVGEWGDGFEGTDCGEEGADFEGFGEEDATV